MRTGLTERVQEKLEHTNFRDRTFNRSKNYSGGGVAVLTTDSINICNIGTPKTT